MMFFGRPDFNLEAAASGHFALVPSEGLNRTGIVGGPLT